MARNLAILTAVLLFFGPVGCVRRTISIQSTPPGALVWLNDREVGRTPLDVEFLYYGTYDVRLVREGYEPMLTSGQADAPLWDVAGFDLVSELLPLDLHSQIKWHYDLEPIVEDEASLLERARELRSRVPQDEDQVPESPPAMAPDTLPGS